MTTGGNATEDEAGFNKEVHGEGGKASIEFVTPEIYRLATDQESIIMSRRATMGC